MTAVVLKKRSFIYKEDLAEREPKPFLLLQKMVRDVI